MPPVDAVDIALLEHFLLLNSLFVLEIAQLVVLVHEFRKILVVCDGEREFDGNDEVLNIYLGNVVGVQGLVLAVEVHLKDVGGYVVSVINLEGIYCVLNCLSDELLPDRDTRICKVDWR